MSETMRPNDQGVTMESTTLVMALELSSSQWRVAFTTGVGQRPRRRIVRREQWAHFADEIATAKARFHLSPDAPVVSCYEAGPDGFWIHRFLTALGVENLVVDSASIEVSRRARHAKTDRLDVERLLALVLRYVGGERSALRVVHVPGEADEHRRQLHRELLTLTQDRVRVTNRIRGVLLTLGIHAPIGAQFGRTLKRLQQWNGDPLPTPVRTRLEREWAHVELLTRQMKALVAGSSTEPGGASARTMDLPGAAWLSERTARDASEPDGGSRTGANRSPVVQVVCDRHLHEAGNSSWGNYSKCPFANARAEPDFK